MSFTPYGIIPAVITPLDGNEEVDRDALRRIIRFLLDGGVHGIFVNGTTGEFYALSTEQKRALMETAVQEVAGRVPVYAGAGGITTKECVRLTKLAEEVGADAVSVLTPMFISPSQDDLFEHYATIAGETKLPVILYNNVPKTGVNISVDLLSRLLEIPNIVGIKDSSGDFTLSAEYMRASRVRPDFSVIQGRDTTILAGLVYGSKGAIAACANVAPRLCVDIYEKFKAGDYAGALEAQFAVAPLRIAFNLGTFPAVIKEGLSLLGVDAGLPAKPVRPLKEGERAELKRILSGMGLL